MSSQVFKDRVPVSLLFELLTQICQEQDNYLLLSKTSFQKAKYHELLEPFIENHHQISPHLLRLDKK